jgi:hypothetical protein
MILLITGFRLMKRLLKSRMDAGFGIRNNNDSLNKELKVQVCDATDDE